MYLLELNADTWNTKKMIKRPNFIFCSKWPWPTNLVFYIISSFLSSCTKWSYLQQSIHQGRKKQGHCVQGDYKHFGNQTHSPSGVFCLGVYYTRDNTDKDCYIRQGRSQYGAFRTSTVFTGLFRSWYNCFFHFYLQACSLTLVPWRLFLACLFQVPLFFERLFPWP